MNLMDQDSGASFENESTFSNPLDDASDGAGSPKSPTSRVVRLGRFASVQGHSKDNVMTARTSYDAHDQVSVDKMRALFGQFDVDGDGHIDAEELQAGLERAGVRVSPVDARSVLKSIDRLGTNGTIDFDDFYDLMYRSGATTGDVRDVVHAFVGVRGTVTGSSKVILECEEDEEHLAKPMMAEGDDLFDILKQRLVDVDEGGKGAGTQGSSPKTATSAIAMFNITDMDSNSLLEPDELRQIVENVMGPVTDVVFTNLFRQIDVRSCAD